MNDVTAISQFIEENISVVDEDRGPVIGATLIHHYGVEDTEVYAVTASKNANIWGKPLDMAKMFDAQASRHARGVVGGGAQQFRIVLLRGQIGAAAAVPAHILPFSRISPQTAMLSPSGAPMASEPPTNVGMIMQGQRYLEQDKAQVHTMSMFLFNLLATQNQELRLDNRQAHDDERKAREDLHHTAEALITLGMRMAEMVGNRQMEALKFQRSMLLQAELLKMAPAIINTISGQETFPLSAQDTSLIRLMHHHMNEDTRQAIIDGVSKNNPTNGASLADRLAQLDREAAEDEAELAKMKREATGGGAIEEAAGDIAKSAAKREAATKQAPAELTETTTPRDLDKVDIAIDRDHKATKAEARAMVDELIGALSKTMPVTATWDGDRMFVAAEKGPASGTRGIVEITDKEIRLRIGSLPAMYRMMRGKIEEAVAKDLDALIKR